MNDWKNGGLLDFGLKETVKKEIRLVTIRNSGLNLLYTIATIIPAVHIVREQNSWFLLIASTVFALISLLCFRNGMKRLSAINSDRFEWKEDIVTRKEFGGRYSHSRLFGENGEGYYTQHLLFSYPKGSRIIGIKYLVGETSLNDNLTHLHDPLAYRIKD